MTFFMYLKENPDMRNTLAAIVFGFGVFMIILNFLKLTLPDEHEKIALEAKDELKLLGPFKLVSQNGKEVLSSD